jgi:hypothetical protein
MYQQFPYKIMQELKSQHSIKNAQDSNLSNLEAESKDCLGQKRETSTENKIGLGTWLTR